ncbi:TraX family protein [Xanthomonas campestris]|uniref:TraX family protein n=1 Tax=Xanthomonas campestris TaxID=339 RepID=UPI003CEFB217
MTSGGRELVKWLALLFMTGDHTLKILHLGYVPVIAELGRVAFPLFALVFAYNLAQPGADVAKLIKRLFLWGLIATPIAAIAFNRALPLNILLSFALAAVCIRAIEERKWVVLAFCLLPAPYLVDYRWNGLAVVLGAWLFWRNPAGWRWPRAVSVVVLLVIPLVLLCSVNRTLWPLLALPIAGLAYLSWAIPRTGRAFYVYYCGHLVALAGLSYAMV